MHITVFGAAGDAGRRIVAEALARGHQVDGVVRSAAQVAELPAGVRGLVGDALSFDSAVGATTGRDVVITATRPARGREAELAAVADVLLTALAVTGGRLLVVGGSATLTVPGGGTLSESPDYPAAWQPIATACADQLARCQASADVDWAYLSPPASLQPGERTGRFRLGGDELLADAYGVSALSYEDLAVVLLDEAERPKHQRCRFTAAY